MVYGLLGSLTGGVGGFQPIAWLYMLCPVAAALALRKEKWWGCLFGIVMGAVLAYSAMHSQPQVFPGFVLGMVWIGYYCLMGLICAGATKKN